MSTVMTSAMMTAAGGKPSILPGRAAIDRLVMLKRLLLLDPGRAWASAPSGCSGGPRAPWIHQISRSLRAAASSYSMASTGVSPMPAETSSTGSAPSSRTKSPRGAATSSVAPGRSAPFR